MKEREERREKREERREEKREEMLWRPEHAMSYVIAI
jgi:hypothetical protein